MKAAVTGWFDGNVKPVRKGVYQQRSGGGGVDVGYQYWDGNTWYAWSDDPEGAVHDYRMRRCVSPHHQNDAWRGLAANPAGKVVA